MSIGPRSNTESERRADLRQLYYIMDRTRLLLMQSCSHLCMLPQELLKFKQQESIPTRRLRVSTGLSFFSLVSFYYSKIYSTSDKNKKIKLKKNMFVTSNHLIPCSYSGKEKYLPPWVVYAFITVKIDICQFELAFCFIPKTFFNVKVESNFYRVKPVKSTQSRISD